ncbi:MAG: GNAT family N-acetyltransferase [Candidatus Thermoplasmatota archaeon]
MDTNSDFKIERLNEDNFDYFLVLLERMAKYEKCDPPDKTAEKRLKKDVLSEKPRFHCYLGKIRSEYVSYLLYYFTYSSYLARPILHLEDIFVSEKYRKQGIGQKMFDFCIKKAKKCNCGRMEWCVFNWNKNALEFYNKNDATRLNKTYYRLNKKQIDSFENDYKEIK